MKLKACLVAGLLAGGLVTTQTQADNRRFTYVYEPETMPAGAVEAENWITLRAGRDAEVGQENYSRWDLRQELEFGVTDRYQIAVYMNESAQNYENPATDSDVSSFEWKGISLENIYNLVNPANNPIGVSLYVEGTYSGPEAEVEEKVIIGQRHGDWKWAFNLENATEWEDNLDEVGGELGASFGIARDLGKHWSLGLELRNKTVMPEYNGFDSSAIYLGPVLSYRQEKWWGALTVMPQIYGWNKDGGDGNPQLDLVHGERLNVRLLFGFSL